MEEIKQYKFEGLNIDRVIVHRIYVRTADKKPVEPKLSGKLVKLNQPALDALQQRITKALGNKSHGIEMTIHEHGEGSFFAIASGMMQAEEKNYISSSKKLAEALNKAQLSTTAPGGLLAIISGTVGKESFPFVAAIKAEPQDGFKADEREDQVGMEYIAELLLTDTQRLYKVGFLTRIANNHSGAAGNQVHNYRAFLFDHLMTATETRSAALYFYSNFLGMDTQASSKKLTQDFFEYTGAFIDNLPIGNDQKMDFHEALRAELRSQDATISVVSFSVKHFPDKMAKEYEKFMNAKGFSRSAINKDTGYIQAKLRKRRRFLFTNNIWISTPPDKADHVQIEAPNTKGITVVKIKGALQGQQ